LSNNNNLISRTEVKEFLGINDTTYDNQIDLFIPIVSGKISSICNQVFVSSAIGTATTGSDVLVIDGQDGDAGIFIYGTGIDGQAEILTWADGVITIDQDSSDNVTDGTYYLNTFPGWLKINVAKLVFFEINRATTSVQGGGIVASRSLGSFSVSYRASDLDRKTGYPADIIGEILDGARVEWIWNGGRNL
jgi:hypothetical protein